VDTPTIVVAYRW